MAHQAPRVLTFRYTAGKPFYVVECHDPSHGPGGVTLNDGHHFRSLEDAERMAEFHVSEVKVRCDKPGGTT